MEITKRFELDHYYDKMLPDLKAAGVVDKRINELTPIMDQFKVLIPLTTEELGGNVTKVQLSTNDDIDNMMDTLQKTIDQIAHIYPQINTEHVKSANIYISANGPDYAAACEITVVKFIDDYLRPHIMKLKANPEMDDSSTNPLTSLPDGLFDKTKATRIIIAIHLEEVVANYPGRVGRAFVYQLGMDEGNEAEQDRLSTLRLWGVYK